MTSLLAAGHLLLLRLADVVAGQIEGPAPEDVKAGWTALAVFLLLAVGMVILGISLTKQLRKAQAAKEAGVYGDEPGRLPDDSSDRPEEE